MTTVFPESILRGLRPEPFDGKHRDHRAENWFIRFERYCNAAQVSAQGQDRITFASLLLTGVVSQWFEQLGTIEATMTTDGKHMSAYDVFKNKFRQQFINANDSFDAFDRIRELRQKRSVNEYVIQFEQLRSRLSDLDDGLAVKFFRSGLKPELRQLVDNHPEIAENDINGLISLAERLDRMKYDRPHYFQSRNFHKPQRMTSNQEVYPQPMDLDAIQAHPNSRSKFQQPSNKIKETDFAKGNCFYCHKPGHRINDCPERNKKSVNFRAH
ncbi:hypothetical protein EMPS_07866 [Entomortierella parvispora]|uniref:CCHC-type domain-containing protein n=1 Tax=Entomortierella parvispora TaxID=205924 RepID=A0A9P3HFB7_9FUNG|nr:hypothetical protein EMPS_07866 [Entomortierella parvispora]